jgi:hypothetical protein
MQSYPAARHSKSARFEILQKAILSSLRNGMKRLAGGTRGGNQPDASGSFSKTIDFCLVECVYFRFYQWTTSLGDRR